MKDWIRESNLIEEVDDPDEDNRSLRAWNWLLTQKELNLEVICGTHKRIMSKLRPDIAGKLRTENVCLMSGNIVLETFPEHTLVYGLLMEQIKNTKDSTCWDDIKYDHIAFEGVHPFIDGNGRTGRMLMNWQRVQIGLKPLCIKASERWDYYEWFNTRGSR